VKCQVANSSGEAWKWKNVKRKTDRDDALKLAQLAALQQLPTVYVPAPETRQRRALLNYRQSLVARRVAIQNHLRTIVQREGILLDRGGRAWTAAGLEVIQPLAKPLEQCSADELWRGEAALELQALEAVTKLLREVECKLEVFAASDESVSPRAVSFAKDAGRSGLDLAALQPVGPTADATALAGPEDTPEASDRGAGAKAVGALLGHVAGQH